MMFSNFVSVLAMMLATYRKVMHSVLPEDILMLWI